MRYLICLICCFLSFQVFADEDESLEELILSTPDQLSALRSEPSYLIGGILSPLGGQPILKQTDLVVKGAQSISLTRIYIPPYIPCAFPKYKHNQEEFNKIHLHRFLTDNYTGWHFFPQLRLQYNPKLNEVRLSEANGATYRFLIEGSKATLTTPAYAINNVAGDEPSGKYDPRNIRISISNKRKNIEVYSPDGTRRLYAIKGITKELSLLDVPLIYLLQKEILPNGMVLKYHYNEKFQPTYVESLDPKEKHVYASLSILGSPKKGGCQFTSSSGLTVDYGYQIRKLSGTIKQKTKQGELNEKFSYSCPPILTSVSSPIYREESLNYCDRFLLNSYSGKDHLFHTLHAEFGHEPYYCVNKLSLPVGKNDTYQTVFEMDYHPPTAGEKEGSTFVKNKDGTSTKYDFSKDFLITSIKYFDEYSKLKREKTFVWSDHHWLSAIEIKDGMGNLFYRKSYQYDLFGNPILETLSGNLTGKGTNESYWIRKRFSQDGRNLLLNEEHENGKAISYAYLPNTNLITAKLTKDLNQILLREFFEYDDSHNLINAISDDGAGVDSNDLSGVTQRNLTHYVLRKQAPFLHMPEWVEEKYLQNGVEKLLKRTHLTYDPHGNISQEEVYNANDEYVYTIFRTYNERGDVIFETNPIGQNATYNYDTRGHCIFSTNFSGRIHTEQVFDTNGRLKTLKEVGDGNLIHLTNFKYDLQDRLIQKTDSFQNTTHYTYDLLANKVAKTEFPPVLSLKGKALAVTTSSSYDSLGRNQTQTDENGNTTSFQYNAYGSVTKIIHPNGSEESFLYSKDNHLKKWTDREGNIVEYERDIFGRILSESTYSPKKALVGLEIFEYKGSQQLKHIDKEGHITNFFYDGAGRKIKEEFCGREISYRYDPFGRLSSKILHNRENTLIVSYQWDLLDRLVEKSKTDKKGNLLHKVTYTYDEDGNQQTITRYINGKESTTNYSHDPFRRVIEEQDALGDATKTSYDENHLDILGRRVLKTTIISPENTTLIKIHDVLARVVSKEKHFKKQVLSSKDMGYDPCGNLIEEQEHIFIDGNFQETQSLKCHYDCQNNIASYTRASGTQNERTTRFTYTPSGKIATKTLPNGITLTYKYNSLGFLKSLESSDEEISHIFEYDRLGNLTKAKDKIKNIFVERTIDPFGNILSETFSTGLSVEKSYDKFNRILKLSIPNQAEISYRYNPLYLKNITRKSTNGKKLYTHSYDSYDLSGNPLTESLLVGLGEISHEYDLLGRKTSTQSPYHSEKSIYSPEGNITQRYFNEVRSSYTYDKLSQLTSEIESKNALSYTHDSLYNRLKKNAICCEYNDLNEQQTFGSTRCSYDMNGNLSVKETPTEAYHLKYDPLNRLTNVETNQKNIQFTYDPLGRCLSKTVKAKNNQIISKETYLYDGQHEIGAVSSEGVLKQLRILGIRKHDKIASTVGIELEGRYFACLCDHQDHLSLLIDPTTKTIANRYSFTAFGELKVIEEKLFNPWRFACKRFNPEIPFINFGKRYYDPELGRWLSTDPAEFLDSTNLYQFLFNNPLRYNDPDGQFAFLLALPFIAFGTSITLPTLTACITSVVCGVVTGAVAYGGYKLVNDSFINKNTDVYAPDRPLPMTEDGRFIPDSSDPHTQLGTEEGRKGKYPQGREFGKDGKPVRDIDFTDHGRPNNHTNPHQHRREENKTGGTPTREDSEPLPEWRYE